VTFPANFFVIQEHGTGRVIGDRTWVMGSLLYETKSFNILFCNSKPKSFAWSFGSPKFIKIKDDDS